MSLNMVDARNVLGELSLVLSRVGSQGRVGILVPGIRIDLLSSLV